MMTEGVGEGGTEIGGGRDVGGGRRGWEGDGGGMEVGKGGGKRV